MHRVIPARKGGRSPHRRKLYRLQAARTPATKYIEGSPRRHPQVKHREEKRMARLVGFIGNRPDLGARVIDLEGRALSVRRRPGVTPGWGVGFYQAGEILLKRRPIDDRDEVRPADITGDVRADTLVA